MIAYITQQGAKVVRDGRRLIVQTATEKYDLFSWELEQLLIFGNVTVTQPALRLLVQEDVDIAYFQLNGRFLGRFETDEPKNVFLRKKQFLLTDDHDFCLKVAKRIVEGKLRNQAMFLQRVRRARKHAEIGDYAQKIKGFADEATRCQSIARLRGLEGFAAVQYFKGFACGFSEQWNFTKRVRRPPTDPVNAVLSLLYTLLISRMYSAVREAHLDPYPAVLHNLSYGRHSLPLDLVEEFRPLIADALTLSLFNMKMLQTKDFYKEGAEEDALTDDTKEQDCEKKTEQNLLERVINDPITLFSRAKLFLGLQKEEVVEERPFVPTKYAVRLHRESLNKVITAFSKKMESRFQHPTLHKEINYSEAMVLQAKQYRQVVEGNKDEYEPLLLR